MPKFSSFNAFGSASNEVGQSHVPVWLGTVAPHAVGGTIATAFLKPGLHLPAGMAVNLNDKISFVTKIGALSYVHATTKRGDAKVKGDEFNIGIDGSDLQFSVYYNF